MAESLSEADYRALLSCAGRFAREGGVTEPRDLVHDSYLRSRTATGEVVPPLPYLRAAIATTAADAGRRSRVRAHASLDRPVGEGGATLGELLPDPADTAAAAETRLALAAVLARARTDRRVALLVAVGLGHSGAELARGLGLPRATVGTRLHRGRQALAEAGLGEVLV